MRILAKRHCPFRGVTGADVRRCHANAGKRAFDESSSVHVFVLPALLRDFVPTVNIILFGANS